MTTLVDDKTENKPDYKQGKEYVEKQKTTTYATEIIPAKNPKLAKLEDRDEYMFSNSEAEKEFKKNERKLVKERRDKYANREKARIREVVSTDIQERRLRATTVIQKWFRTRRATNSSCKAPPNLSQSNLSQSKDQGAELQVKEEARKQPSRTLEVPSEKKKERRRRDKRKKMNGSLSQDNIQISNTNEKKGSDEGIFKNKLLLQGLKEAGNKNAGSNGEAERNEEKARKNKEEIDRVLQEKKSVEEKLKLEQKNLDKLLLNQNIQEKREKSSDFIAKPEKYIEKPEKSIEKPEKSIEKPEKFIEKLEKLTEKPKEKPEKPIEKPEKPIEKFEKPSDKPKSKEKKSEKTDKSSNSTKHSPEEKPLSSPTKKESSEKKPLSKPEPNKQSEQFLSSTSKKKAGFARVDDQKDREKNLAIEKRRKTGGVPLKKAKNKKKAEFDRYDISSIRDMEKEAAEVIQVYYRYRLRKRSQNKTRTKCHKATQVELDLLLPSGMLQNFDRFLKSPPEENSNAFQALALLMFSFSKAMK